MSKSGPPNLESIHVLIVDDNEDTREILTAFLAHLGAVVTTARNAGEALAALGELRAHVIVSDLSMPAIDGHEFLTRVRRLPDEANNPTPAIAFSGFEDERSRATETGYASFIAKPADPLVVAREIKRLTAGAAIRGRSPTRKEDRP